MEIARGDLALVEEARIDPLRVIEGVIGGIGFLGAGSIIQSRGSVEGITTAATIWIVGAIGVACGMGYYIIAILTVSLAWLILTVLVRLERKFSGIEQTTVTRHPTSDSRPPPTPHPA
ncbi:MAG: MgtC/SapB family protein [Acidobacteriota bacterium]